jgi:hypothetical protein
MLMRRPGSGATVPANWGIGRSRISWGAVLAGAVTALATSLLLGLLGAAMGAGWTQPFNLDTLGRLSTAAVLWSIINLALSMALGGYVAARLSGTHSHQDGELHGLATWAVAVLLGTWLISQLLGSLGGLFGQGIGSLVTRAVDSEMASSVMPPEVNVRGMIDRLRQSLRSSDDLTTMNREQIGAEINALVQGSLGRDLTEQDFERLVALVAAESGITKEEAMRRVSRLDNESKANRAQVAERARVAAETAAQGAGTAARALFTALTTGLLGALLGAWFGTRHKRELHPPETMGHEARERAAGASGQRAGGHRERERAQPSSVSVHDENGRLVSQYLRDASFPMTKQDLLRLARAGSARPQLIQAIEAMPDGYYGSIDEVMEALDMAHAS